MVTQSKHTSRQYVDVIISVQEGNSQIVFDTGYFPMESEPIILMMYIILKHANDLIFNVC